MSSHTQTRQTIIRLLSSMASAKEINQYLSRFSQMDAKRFAVVKVGGAVLRDDMEALTSSLSFLQQVGLNPIVVHGVGPQLDACLQAHGIEKKIINGLRVTDASILGYVRQTFQLANLALVEALQQQGARAFSITSGVFQAEYFDRHTLGYVGAVASVDLALVDRSLDSGFIPVIASLGETAEGQIVNINADFAVNALIKKLQPYKIIFLTGTGGLLDAEGKIIDSINLSTEYDALIHQPWLQGGMKLKIQQIKDILDNLPVSSSVSITCPADMAKELFTHKGSGTLVRKGERVMKYTRWEDVDSKRLRQLIESSFGRVLVDDYFQQTPVDCVYISENYRAALVISNIKGICYLDKFAVSDVAQGEGLGRAVWDIMRHDIPRLFWRSRSNNPINTFYFAQAEGCIKHAQWNVFWYGIQDFTTIETCVAHCNARAATFVS